MFTKRQVVLGGIAIVLATAILTTSAFIYFFRFLSGDASLTLKFLGALYTVRQRYVEPVSTDVLINGAISGMVNSLKDPHSAYLDGNTYKYFMSETEGEFGGVGIIVGVKDDVLTVVAPVEGTPGEIAGIKSGDKIIKINGELTKGMSINTAVSKIRGPKDTNVQLVLLTDTKEEKTVNLTRTNIKLKTVYSNKLQDDIGYIRITMFNEHTHEDFAKQLDTLEKEGVKSIVLDLRNNPGGILQSSVKVAEKLVPNGPIVSIVGRDGTKEIINSNNPNAKYKIAVLVNKGSASASEIVAGALQDTKVGTIIGTKTYGKGSVQAVIPVGNDSAIKLTGATYHTPSGRVINGVGIEPDIEVKLSEQIDNQLEKAIEILQKQNENTTKK